MLYIMNNDCICVAYMQLRGSRALVGCSVVGGVAYELYWILDTLLDCGELYYCILLTRPIGGQLASSEQNGVQ